jgi:predicted enzyme related to lactoylglutathione lyase
LNQSKLINLYKKVKIKKISIEKASENIHTDPLQRGHRMKAGQAVQVLISAPNLEESLAFYEKLGFKKLDGSSVPNPWALLSDGVMLFLLNQTPQHYLGIAYFADTIEAQVGQLQKAGVKMTTNVNAGQLLQGVCFDPNGFGISFIQGDTASLPKPEGESSVSCGKFFEISIPTTDVIGSVAFWRKLGFEIKYGDPPGKGWASMSDGLIGIGLYTRTACNHQFPIPAVTYFSNDSEERIKKMKKDGIKFIEDIANKEGLIADAIMASPESQHLFCFHGEF